MERDRIGQIPDHRHRRPADDHEHEERPELRQPEHLCIADALLGHAEHRIAIRAACRTVVSARICCECRQCGFVVTVLKKDFLHCKLNASVVGGIVEARQRSVDGGAQTELTFVGHRRRRATELRPMAVGAAIVGRAAQPAHHQIGNGRVVFVHRCQHSAGGAVVEYVRAEAQGGGVRGGRSVQLQLGAVLEWLDVVDAEQRDDAADLEAEQQRLVHLESARRS